MNKPRCKGFLVSTVSFILFMVALTSCTGTSSTDLRATTEISVETPLVLLTSVYTPISQPVPTSTIQPISSPPQTNIISADGQWLLIPMKNGIWALNEEGGSLVKFSDIREGYGLAVSESGGPIAVKTASTLTGKPATSGLHLLDFPSAEVTNHSNVLILKPTVWSHDGSRLAVIQRTPNSYSLVSLTIKDGEMITLLEGLTDIGTILWSHDDEWILIGGKTRPGGSELSDFTYWKVHPDGSGAEVIYQQEIPGMTPNGGVTLGWISDTVFVSDAYHWRCRFSDLKKIDLITGNVVSLWPENYSDRAIDTESGTMLVSITDSRDRNFPLRHEPGLYLISTLDGSTKKISEEFSNCGYWWSMEWSPEAERFFVLAGNELLAVNLEGEITRLQTPFPPRLTVSPAGSRWTITSQLDDPGLWIGTPYEPPREISSELVVDPIWSKSGETLYFFVNKDTRLSDLYIAHAPEFEPELISSDLPYVSYQVDPIWVSTSLSVTDAPSTLAWPTPTPEFPSSQQLLNLPADSIDVYFYDNMHGWLLGENAGKLALGITVDGGYTWRAAQVPDAVVAEAWEVFAVEKEDLLPRAVRWLHFSSPQQGWAYGPNLFATDDGGNSWIDVSPPGSVESIYTSDGVTFALERVTCTEGEPYLDPVECQYLLHELSPGASISKTTEIPTAFHGGDLYPIDADRLWILANVEKDFIREPLLLSTDNGGKSWTETTIDCQIGANRVFDFAIAGEDHLLFGCGDYGSGALGQKMIYLSTDRGRNWQLVGDTRLDSEPRPDDLSISGYLGGIGATSENLVWMTLGRNWPLISRDGGFTWTSLDFAPLDDGFISVFFIDESNGWSTHRANVYLTSDSGRTWKWVIAGDATVASVHSVKAVDDKNVWVVGRTHWEGDVLFHTRDGGKTWDCLSLPELTNCDLGEIWQIVP